MLATLLPLRGGLQAERPPRQKWDFGYVPQKSVVSHVFYLHNHGEKPLTITHIKPGCSCTSVSELEGPIAPGDSAGITVSFKSGRYHHRLQKTTLIETDDPDTPKQMLSILASAYADDDTTGFIEVSPAKLMWSTKIGQLVFPPDTVWFTNRSPDTVQVELLASPGGLFDWVLADAVLAPAETTRMIFTPRKEAGARKVSGASATIEFSKGRETIVTIPLGFDY
jgi:hypothetical protein